MIPLKHLENSTERLYPFMKSWHCLRMLMPYFHAATFSSQAGCAHEHIVQIDKKVTAEQLFTV